MRLYRIDQVLQEEGSVSFETLQAALQCSAPTLKRDLRYMREKLGAPIVYSRSQNAYSYARDGAQRWIRSEASRGLVYAR